MRSHLFIPDTQVKPGCPTAHLRWIGKYIVDRRPDVIVHIGDHWDLPSLSSYDEKGSKNMEGKRYVKDVKAGNDGFTMIDEPIRKTKGYNPEKHFLLGNHENRISVAIGKDPRLEGSIGLEDLDTRDWTVHPFLEPVDIDGVIYAHYFYQPLTGHPFAGGIDNRLKQIGHSFSMGHQQTLLYGVRFVAGRSQHGLVAGACYLHDEAYKGPQGNAHWRGVIVKHEVSEGSYSPMFVSMDYLCRKYEGVSLTTFMKGIKCESN